jgi:4-amino-4-deoxy-L-arabinose transferase-like glycosyltransferase
MLQYIKRLSRIEQPRPLDWLVYFAGFTILHIPAILNFNNNDGSSNAYLLFAESLSKGTLSLPDTAASYMDMISYHGQHYLPYPPLPSLILLPFVALFGASHVNTVAVALIMSCLNFYLLYKIFLRIKLEQNYFGWLAAAFFFGTGYWYALFTTHHVYAFAHITSCLFQLLLLAEILGKRRWWLVGIYIGCSFLSRQFTIFYIVFALGYMLHLHQQKIQKIKPAHVISLFGSVGFFIGLYLLYNYLRFANALEPGYNYINYIGVLKERVDEYGVFSIKYLPFNAYSFFIKGFNIEFMGSGLIHIKDMDLWGTSLIAGSPFVVMSLKAKWPKLLLISAWATTILILAGFLFYHNNGFHQVNCMRFALDFLPLLFILIALGAKQIPAWLLKGMICYAIFLNLLSFLIHFIYQAQ